MIYNLIDKYYYYTDIYARVHNPTLYLFFGNIYKAGQFMYSGYLESSAVAIVMFIYSAEGLDGWFWVFFESNSIYTLFSSLCAAKNKTY